MAPPVAWLLVAGEFAVVAPVRLLGVLEHDVDLVGGRLADPDQGVGDGGHELALLLIGAAGIPLDRDVGHGSLLGYLSRFMSSGKLELNAYDLMVPSALNRTVRSLLISPADWRSP